MTRSAPYSTMPGTFATADRAGPKSHLFQPPCTPSASSSAYLSRSNISMFSEPSDRPTLTSRKRSRNDYTIESNATPASSTGDWSYGMDASDSMIRSENMDPGSPAPFVNTRYQLSGGLDTPTAAAAAQHYVENSEYSEVGFRKTLGQVGAMRPEENDPFFPYTPAPQLTDANGRPRIHNQEPHSAGWSKLAIDVVGSVVGKVWEFCKAGAFRGFTAGGGKAYNINPSQPHTPMESNSRTEFWDEKADRNTTPIPGEYKDDDFIADYIDRRNLESTPPRPSKRLHVSNDDGELAQNWIMVSSTTAPRASTPQSVTRPAARYSMPTASSASRRLAGNAAARPVASRANNRRSLLSNRQPSVSHAGSPGLHAGRPASFASPRSPGGSRVPLPKPSPKKAITSHVEQNSMASPASIEAQKWAAKMRKEEMEQDQSMRRLNAQLQAMIRQGKEALGTKVEIDEVDELVMEELHDDGFEDSEYSISGKWVP